jgi:hypothetical protein
LDISAAYGWLMEKQMAQKMPYLGRDINLSIWQ